MYIYLLCNGAGTQQMFEMTNYIYSNPALLSRSALERQQTATA